MPIPQNSMLTRDVDLMIRRFDIGRVVGIAEGCGFKSRHAAGPPEQTARGDMLLHGDTAKSPLSLYFCC
jgi:hypothetical protein